MNLLTVSEIPRDINTGIKMWFLSGISEVLIDFYKVILNMRQLVFPTVFRLKIQSTWKRSTKWVVNLISLISAYKQTLVCQKYDLLIIIV